MRTSSVVVPAVLAAALSLAMLPHSQDAAAVDSPHTVAEGDAPRESNQECVPLVAQYVAIQASLQRLNAECQSYSLKREQLLLKQRADIQAMTAAADSSEELAATTEQARSIMEILKQQNAQQLETLRQEIVDARKTVSQLEARSASLQKRLGTLAPTLKKQRKQLADVERGMKELEELGHPDVKQDIATLKSKLRKVLKEFMGKRYREPDWDKLFRTHD